VADLLPAAGRGGTIRLLWLIDSLAAGGAEALTVAFARALAAGRAGGGAELEVAYLKSLGGNPLEEELRAAGVPVTGLGARNLRDLAAFRRLLALVRSGRFDLVHAHLAYASIWGLLAGRATGRPVVATLHVRPPAAPAWSREGLRRRLLVAAANRWAARALAVSGAVRDAWTAAGLASERVTVVHNGVDVGGVRLGAGEAGAARAAIRRELGVAADAPLALTVSVLRPGKGLEVLLEAVPAVLDALHRARFAVVGDGPAREPLQASAAAAGLTAALVWTGFRRDVPDLLAAADLFVLPSLDDAFPTALLEAMAAGLPVVATRAGGIPEIVDDGATGRLVPPGDPAALARAVAALLGDPAARRALGRAGRRRVAERFSTAVWLGRLEAVYAEALGRPVTLRPGTPHPVAPAEPEEPAARPAGKLAREAGA
jgi:glycosyltransferase involved in cell wall biosynthesis